AAELAAVPAALAGIALTAGDGRAAAGLTVLGAILAAAALRRDRRPLGWAAAACVQLAGWILLAEQQVSAPEAYTVPLSVGLGLLGWLRRRPDPTLGSWAAYAPALAITAAPSLAAAQDGLRPLLLGAAALAVLLAGARARLQAPLALGAGTLALLALDQLGPAFAELTAVLPTWLPPAVAGALLLVLGSTYEKRVAQLRRARTAFGGLS
ncbi:MAG: hypothetical protein AVDCRST_MAG41-2164, partial [uncultured Corynebacteriales bacterium]